MKNQIAKEFHFFSLLKFAFPSIVMMVFMSLYTMVDGMFVSQFVGTKALSAVNIVYPIYNIIIAIGIMLATGGSAVIAKKLGEKKPNEARENFSLIIFVGFVIGVVIFILATIFIHPLLNILGANESLYKLCYDYATALLWFTPFAILQLLFQYFFVTAGKPGIGLAITIIGGLTNMVLDYIFIVPLNMGVVGAAIATGIGIIIPAIYGLIYFTFCRKGTLFLVKPKLDGKVLFHSCINGSSEMVSNVALAVVTILYNIIMLKLLGEDGVAAITIMLYTQFLLSAVFMGFSMGVAPVISYHYGSQNVKQIKKLFKYCMVFILTSSIVSFLLAVLLAPFLIEVFAPKGSNVYIIALQGFGLFSINYLFSGMNIFTSSLFTAFSNGLVSAIISFMRTFVFITAGLIILPAIFGINGVWVAMTVAEGMTLIMCIYYLKKYKTQYQYL